MHLYNSILRFFLDVTVGNGYNIWNANYFPNRDAHIENQNEKQFQYEEDLIDQDRQSWNKESIDLYSQEHRLKKL